MLLPLLKAFISIRRLHLRMAQNEAGENQGSAKVFAFAIINNLSKEDTLLLFAEHYQSVLETPEGIDHQNIRQFMTQGWAGIQFEGVALTAK
jgi:hypothetical protein